jgi:hypothetical protein
MGRYPDLGMSCELASDPGIAETGAIADWYTTQGGLRFGTNGLLPIPPRGTGSFPSGDLDLTQEHTATLGPASFVTYHFSHSSMPRSDGLSIAPQRSSAGLAGLRSVRTGTVRFTAAADRTRSSPAVCGRVALLLLPTLGLLAPLRSCLDPLLRMRKSFPSIRRCSLSRRR